MCAADGAEMRESKCEAADIDKVVRSCTHLDQKQQNDPCQVLEKCPKLFDNELGTHPDERMHLDLKPDAVTFSAVISAWANSGDPRAGERARVLFRQVQHLSGKPGYNIRLDAGFYRSVLGAFAVSGDTATAEALLATINRNELKGVKADRYMYHALLRAYAKSDDKDAAERAEAHLKDMTELSVSTRNNFVKPHAACYMSVLECWAKSEHSEKAVERSEALLSEMEEKAKHDPQVKPTPAAYTRYVVHLSKHFPLPILLF